MKSRRRWPKIRGDDLAVAARLVGEAEQLASRLGIRNARVYINPEDRLGVGYLHVHIVGERDPTRPYPQMP